MRNKEIETMKKLLEIIIGKNLFGAIVELAEQNVPADRRDEFILKIANYCLHLKPGQDIYVAIRHNGEIKQFTYFEHCFLEMLHV